MSKAMPEVDAPGLKSALQRERELRKADAAKWKAFGKTPDQIYELIVAREAAPQIEMILGQHQKQFESEKARLESELNIAKASELRTIVETTITEGLRRSKATAEGLDLLGERLGARVRLESVDGKRVTTIMQADGVTPMKGTGPNGLATFPDLIKEHVGLFPSLFEGTGAGGSGTDPKGQRRLAHGKVLTRTEFNALSPVDRAAKMKAGFTPVD
jgi:hypothetical protein